MYERVIERVIFRFVHGTVDIVPRAAFLAVIARGAESGRHIHAVGSDNGRRRVIEMQSAAKLFNVRRQRFGGERSRCDHRHAVCGQSGHLGLLDRDERMPAHRIGHGGGKQIPIHCQRATRRHSAFFRDRHTKRAECFHFRLEQPRRTFDARRLERIGADKLRKKRRAVRRRVFLRLHFFQCDRHAALCRSICRFTARQSRADHRESFFVHFFSNPQSGVWQYSPPFLPLRLNSVLPHFGQTSADGSSQLMKLQSG